MSESPENQRVRDEYARLALKLKKHFETKAHVEEETGYWTKSFLTFDGKRQIAFGQGRNETVLLNELVILNVNPRAAMYGRSLLPALHDLGKFCEYQDNVDGYVDFVIDNFQYVMDNYVELEKLANKRVRKVSPRW